MTKMLSILLLWTSSLKYCSKLKGEYENSKSGSGTSVGLSLTPLGLSFKKNSRDTGPLSLGPWGGESNTVSVYAELSNFARPSL